MDIESVDTIDLVPLREQGSHPSTPASGTTLVYSYNGTIYSKDDAGNETDLGSGGGGGVTSVFGRTGAVSAVEGDYDLSELGDVSAAAQTANFVMAAGDGSTGGDYRGRALVAADIPNLAASKITSGTLAQARGGTNVDSSAYHGVMQFQSGTPSQLKYNFNASVAPTTTDDTTAGYSVGSRWYDTTADKAYECLDATASAAVWHVTDKHAASDIVSGTLVHERGGLEADVSAYNGFPKIVGGATSAVAWSMEYGCGNGAFGSHRATGLTAAGNTVPMGGKIPSHVTTITSARIRLILNSATGNEQYDVALQAGAIDEQYNAVTASSSNQTLTLTSNADIYEINVDSLFSSVTGGDSFGILFTNDKINSGNIYIIAVILEGY